MSKIVIKDLKPLSQNSCQTLNIEQMSSVQGGCGGMGIIVTFGTQTTTLDSVACSLSYL